MIFLNLFEFNLINLSNQTIKYEHTLNFKINLRIVNFMYLMLPKKIILGKILSKI